MKFKIDENLPAQAATILQQAGFGAHTVLDEALCGAADQTLASRARDEARVLITLDLDFANIRAYPPSLYSGIIVLRLNRQDKATVMAFLRRTIQVLRERSPVGELWIVQRDHIRFRQGG